MRDALATNNPEKARVFGENGYLISTFVPVVVPPTELTRNHLSAKQEKLGHVDLIRKEEERGTRNFMLLLDAASARNNSLVCCGLDPDITKMPKEITDGPASEDAKASEFLRETIDITAPHVSAYKMQKAFFDLFENGQKLLAETVRYIKAKYPTIPIILDSKIGDIENTMDAYLKVAFDRIKVDAVVVNPYMGGDVISPFRNAPDKAAVVLVKTSNPDGSVIQDMIIRDGKPLWMHVLQLAMGEWNASRNLIPVISTIANIDFCAVRKMVPDGTPILLAGFGAQGGQLDGLDKLLDSKKRGVMINSSRGILYPYRKEDPDWRKAIERSVVGMKDHINSLRVEADGD